MTITNRDSARQTSTVRKLKCEPHPLPFVQDSPDGTCSFWVVNPRVCNQWKTHLTEFEGEEDHVYLLINYPPKLALFLLVNRLKGVSSRVIRQQQYPSIQRQFWGGTL